MAAPIDYKALYEGEKARREAAEAQHEGEKARREAAEAQHEEEKARREAAEAQLAKTPFHDFLKICHSNVFLKLAIEPNEMKRTTGGLTNVKGKVYPRKLMPWRDFASRLEACFAFLEATFRQDSLFPSPAGLGYLEDKLRDKQLASEEDLKNFECLAVEGCTLDVLPRLLDRLNRGRGGDGDTESRTGGSPAIAGLDLLQSVSFNNYPFGVVAASDEEVDEDADATNSGDGSTAASRSASREPSRGRTRQRSAAKTRKPLRIKDDCPAYLGALGVARRDMDAATERAAAKAEERDKSGPPPKRPSPERTKVHPDQWCFRHDADDVSRPLFVVEYKAAHKIDLAVLRRALEPANAATLMRDAAAALATSDGSGGGTAETETTVAQRDIAKVFAQSFHYMVDYGLQYCYATTGHALIFLHLDPALPSTLYYHLEEPAQTVDPASRDGLKHSAVGLVTSFVLMALGGQYMTNRWKKAVHRDQPKWPQPYGEPGAAATIPQLAPPAGAVLPTVNSAAGAGCGDPQKRGGHRRRGEGDDEDGGDAGGPSGSPSGPASASAAQSAARRPGGAATAPTRTARPAGRETKRSAQGAASWPWWRPVDAPLTPSLDYCTQACLLGLKTGGAKDPRCPNVRLHRRREGDEDGSSTGPHPITAEALRDLLTQQLAEDLDTDCQSLERYGMYGAIGALFKLALSAYGYCFVGKGVQRVHSKALQREAAAYGLLEACQGRLVPVSLGIVHLVDAYWTECGAHIADMMLLAYAGDSLWHVRRAAIRAGTASAGAADAVLRLRRLRTEAERTLAELEQYGIEHGDDDEANLAWSDELQRVLAIDLDRAVFLDLPEAPAPASEDQPHRRRKASHEGIDAQDAKRARAAY